MWRCHEAKSGEAQPSATLALAQFFGPVNAANSNVKADTVPLHDLFDLRVNIAIDGVVVIVLGMDDVWRGKRRLLRSRVAVRFGDQYVGLVGQSAAHLPVLVR